MPTEPAMRQRVLASMDETIALIKKSIDETEIHLAAQKRELDELLDARARWAGESVPDTTTVEVTTEPNGLRVWTQDDEEWVVAESAEDAVAVYVEATNVSADYPGSSPADWQALPDDKMFTLSEECPEHHDEQNPCPRDCDEQYMIVHTRPAAEWAQGGRRYLGSANA